MPPAHQCTPHTHACAALRAQQHRSRLSECTHAACALIHTPHARTCCVTNATTHDAPVGMHTCSMHVCAHLTRTQALRYERDSVSRLSKFLVARALANPTFAITLHWYLFTEFEDAGFGSRASLIHAHLLQVRLHARAALWVLSGCLRVGATNHARSSYHAHPLYASIVRRRCSSRPLQPARRAPPPRRCAQPLPPPLPPRTPLHRPPTLSIT